MKTTVYLLLVATLLGCMATDADAQSRRRHRARVDPQDSLPIFEHLTPVVVNTTANNSQERQAYMRRVENTSRLRKNVRKIYPLAKEVARMAERIERDLANITNDAERRRYIRNEERQLFAQYESTIRNMTRSQGELLIKLVHRQTGRSAYQLIETFRTDATATFWQTVSRLYGASLRETYDPAQNQQIEMVIQMIENGESDEVTVQVY
jgi:hypothetical protein